MFMLRRSTKRSVIFTIHFYRLHNNIYRLLDGFVNGCFVAVICTAIKNNKMKRDAFDMFKATALLVVTSLLVMAYTTIERAVATPSVKTHDRVVLPAVTPVAIGLMDKPENTKTYYYESKKKQLCMIKQSAESK
jgi:hypothetical protein